EFPQRIELLTCISAFEWNKPMPSPTLWLNEQLMTVALHTTPRAPPNGAVFWLNAQFENVLLSLQRTAPPMNVVVFATKLEYSTVEFWDKMTAPPTYEWFRKKVQPVMRALDPA